MPLVGSWEDLAGCGEVIGRLRKQVRSLRGLVQGTGETKPHGGGRGVRDEGEPGRVAAGIRSPGSLLKTQLHEDPLGVLIE